MGQAQAAMPNISAWERKGRRGASRSVWINHIQACPLGGSEHPTILITKPVLAMGRQRMSPSPDASL